MDTQPEDDWTAIVDRGLSLDVEGRLPAGFAERVGQESELGVEEEPEPSSAPWWIGMAAMSMLLIVAHIATALPMYRTVLSQTLAAGASIRLDLIAAAATAVLATEAVARYLGRRSSDG